jgi:hypothetical protein
MNLLVKAHNRKVHVTRCKDGDFAFHTVRLSSIEDCSIPVVSERYTTRDKKKMIRVTSMKLSKRTVEMLMHGILEFERKEQKEQHER